jgi:glycosyltransferase involved in cell wall biosynthesis
MTVSVVIITLNEQRNIAPCLESVAWADERIVVDAQSSDRTTDLARAHTNKVFIRPWPGYGPQKNFGIDQARGEWILILDADERVTDALRDEILGTIRSPSREPEIVGYEIPRRNFFYGHWIRSGGIWPDHQLRLFRRVAGRYDDHLFHERLQLTGKIGRLAAALDHHSMPSVGDHVRKMIRYTTLGAQEKLKRRNRIRAWDVGGNHLGTVLRTYVLRRGYRDGVAGMIVALFAGMHTFVKYAKAWEALQQRTGRSWFEATSQQSGSRS